MDNTKNLSVPIKIILDLGVPILIEPSMCESERGPWSQLGEGVCHEILRWGGVKPNVHLGRGESLDSPAALQVTLITIHYF